MWWDGTRASCARDVVDVGDGRKLPQINAWHINELANRGLLVHADRMSVPGRSDRFTFTLYNDFTILRFWSLGFYDFGILDFCMLGLLDFRIVGMF